MPMMRNRIFARYTFRFMMGYVASLSVAVFVLLASFYVFYSFDYFTDVNNSLENELDLLQSEYRQGGVAAVERLEAERQANTKFVRFAYILVDKDNHKVAGDLTRWPDYTTWSDGWLSFEMRFPDWTGKMQAFNFVARKRVVADGRKLMVARVSDDVRQNIRLVGATLFWSMVIMTVLGLIGASIISFMSLARIESINQSIRTIMAGDLSERIPVQEPADDFQMLAKHLNVMFERIENSMNDVRQVSDNIAHDLRTPLTRLRNKLSTLESRSAPHNREMVQEMLAEADSLLATFSALLRIAQIESGKQQSAFASLELSELLMDVVELYEPLAFDKDIDMSSRIETLATINGDKDLLFQMFVNVIDNAIKYTPEGGKIHVQLESDGMFAQVVVADNGPGISANKYSKVFQRFYRVEASRSVQPGNGLGLSLVKAVANRHNGDVILSDSRHYHSQAERPGLCVRVEIPLAQPLAG